MDMNNFGFGLISNLISESLGAFGPVQVFQAGQSLIIGQFFPDLAADSSVGVVTEGVYLARVRGFREPFGKNLMFRVFGDFVTALSTIDEGDFRALEGV